MRQKLIELQREINKSIIIVGDFNTILSLIDRSSRQKIRKDTDDPNSTNNQLDLIDIYRTLQQQHNTHSSAHMEHSPR